jgi:cupin 2 domain-containing protein
MNVSNLFSNIPDKGNEEVFNSLVDKKNVKIERIISSGQSSPEGFWYDQEKDEWVILLSGSATLSFENEEQLCSLFPGDYIFIPAHCKHRVESTDKHSKTVWLAVHF